MTREDVSLERVLALRSEGARVDEELALALIAADVDGRGTSTDAHAVPWASAAWLAQDVWSSEAWDALEHTLTAGQTGDQPVWSPGAHDVLQRLASSLRSGDRLGTVKISRADVFDRREGDPLELFLAAMAWGHGTVGYGWRRTADIIADAHRNGGANRLAEAVGLLRSSGAGDPEVLFRRWHRGGAAKLRGLGTAFASKVAYFASYDRRRGSGPLIADSNTAWSIWALANISRSLFKAAAYAEYVARAERSSKQLGCRSDDVERALFRLGRDVRDA